MGIFNAEELVMPIFDIFRAAWILKVMGSRGCDVEVGGYVDEEVVLLLLVGYVEEEEVADG